MTATVAFSFLSDFFEQDILSDERTDIMMPMQNRPPVVARKKGNRLWLRSVTFAGMMLGATVAYAVVG